jgi:hypothetical protein
MSGVIMDEHLHRALIEVYYAIAEFNQSYATTPNTEQRADTCARLIVIRANLEKLLPSDQAVEINRAA